MVPPLGDWTHTACSEAYGLLNTGPPGKFPELSFYSKRDISFTSHITYNKIPNYIFQDLAWSDAWLHFQLYFFSFFFPLSWTSELLLFQLFTKPSRKLTFNILVLDIQRLHIWFSSTCHLLKVFTWLPIYKGTSHSN